MTARSGCKHDTTPRQQRLGYWLQHNDKGTMQLQLAFNEGSIRGTGVDKAGAFVVTGEYSVQARHLRFSERYRTYLVSSICPRANCPVLDNLG